MNHPEFFSTLWSDFCAIAPAAANINAQLTADGERVLNDHVAFRTFNKGPISLEKLDPVVRSLGYERFDDYRFEEKKLRAWAYVHPTDADAPKIFVSELLTEEFSPELQAVVDELVAQIPEDFVKGPEVFWAGLPWERVSYDTYLKLREESEYAAWLAALGLRANHFTIFLNEMSDKLSTVEAMLAYVEKHGFEVNSSGGRVKGGEDVHLAQGSTLADKMAVEFSDGPQVVPTCYYEFARRFPKPDGELYQGFVASSADKIFESTNAADR